MTGFRIIKERDKWKWTKKDGSAPGSTVDGRTSIRPNSNQAILITVAEALPAHSPWRL